MASTAERGPYQFQATEPLRGRGGSPPVQLVLSDYGALTRPGCCHTVAARADLFIHLQGALQNLLKRCNPLWR